MSKAGGPASGVVRTWRSRLAGVLTGMALVFGPTVAMAAEEAAPSIDQRINQAVQPVAQALGGAIFSRACIGDGVSLSMSGCAEGQTGVPLIVVWLLLGGVVTTLYFRFINFRGFAQGFRLMRGDYAVASDPGEVSHFQALTSAVSGTVGLGNIAGVALAITVGGPGAAFWMIVAGLLGMSTKFAECTLGVKYRQENPDGTVSGGPMYYLSRGLAERYRGLGGVGKVLAVVFAICSMLGGIGAGSMFQANQAYAQFHALTGGVNGPLEGYGWAFGIGIAVLAGLVVLGGITRIGSVTARLIPSMIVLYLLGCFAVLAVNIAALPEAIAIIFRAAFSGEAAAGGVIGALLAGFQRAAFSNEAGLGSAAIAHSAVKTKHPATEGLVALWEPFVDTVIVCTATALMVVVTGAYKLEGLEGVAITSSAFATVFSWFPYLLTVAVFLFAFSTMLTWAYYGAKAATYITGERRWVTNTYILVYLGAAVVACTMNLGQLIDLSDGLIFLMAIPNLIGVYLLLPVVREEVDDYFAKLKSGEIRATRS
ncbi:alanine/glycine:cation symporter family protein [Silanimonas lenta]|uniref:alanine/glycine:cation symporter family protein n=1 Tax=Silanimonas lenta TaxID=265429 RepID=UPI001B7FBDE6|nr:alanine/glycine:cation symporter family protein [Silanimonas lenta]